MQPSSPSCSSLPFTSPLPPKNNNSNNKIHDDDDDRIIKKKELEGQLIRVKQEIIKLERLLVEKLEEEGGGGGGPEEEDVMVHDCQVS